MMLDHLGLAEASTAVEQAVSSDLVDRTDSLRSTQDIGNALREQVVNDS